jgi:peptidyl-prolyl cis-trans isomerase C
VRTRLTVSICLLLVLSACGVSREDAVPAATVVFANGSTVTTSHRDLNAIVEPTESNQEFVTLAFQGTPPVNFDVTVLSQSILGQVIDNELASLDTEISTEDVDEAKDLLASQLQVQLAASGDPAAEFDRLYEEVPYLPFFVDLQARQIALADSLAEATLPEEGNPCVSHILVETEAEGEELLADLEAGADFATLAIERSVGPSGPNGGDLGCAPAANYVPEFAAAVETAEIGVPVGPLQTQFGWHVLVVDRLEVDGDQLARDRLVEGLSSASVTIDDELGTWDANLYTIVPADS